MFQQITEYHAPCWPEPAYPQQFHLDVTVRAMVESVGTSHTIRPAASADAWLKGWLSGCCLALTVGIAGVPIGVTVPR